MRSAVRYFSSTALALAASLTVAAPNVLAADPPADERDEIIVTHQRLGPLSDWAQMQAHNAEYQRLKAKFDPTPANSAVDSAAADRALTAPGGVGGPGQATSSFVQELNNQSGASPIIQSAKDLVSPP